MQGSGLQVLLLDGSPLSVKPFEERDAAFEPRVKRLVGRQPAHPRAPGRVGRHRRPPRQPLREMQVWDGSGTGQVHFSAASVHAEVLGHIVENRVVQDATLIACMTVTSACWPMHAWSKCAAPAMTGC